ncbi:glycosyltransferase [Catenovulum agarivorans]|uniref:glycosyltransferase n=1 Tax=Catenovulum agarivorans TaxID=1172192 RepID=UPI0002FBE7DD|nr:glycosyltransferase [Catenovulum agarivorans]
MNKLKIKILKEKLIELIKYDHNQWKFLFVLVAHLAVFAHLLMGKRLKAFNIVSSVYRTGWKGSFSFGVYWAKKAFKDNENAKQLVQLAIDDIQPLSNTAQFIEHPDRMLDGIVTVLKSPSNNEKGVIVLNYSYYFLLFRKFYDIEKISQDYIIILEPSWAGFCEVSILSYANTSDSVYLMCYEKRDLDFIQALDCKIKPLKIGPSWFVNHTNFQPHNVERDIDIIMVAAWAKFKRHGAFFKAISKLKGLGVTPKITLVGYPVDMTQDEIVELAEFYGVKDWLTIYESITHQEVSALLNRSKVNVLWSKFEGNNRAIIEGMFCNTIVVMRENHNYGEHYDFINPQTGDFAGEDTLATKVKDLLTRQESFSPRDYVINNRSCIEATAIMNKEISNNERAIGRNWSKDMVVKVNELHQMDYLDISDRVQFKRDYETLLSNLKS